MEVKWGSGGADWEGVGGMLWLVEVERFEEVDVEDVEEGWNRWQERVVREKWKRS